MTDDSVSDENGVPRKRPESLDETYRRLSPYGGGDPSVPQPPPPPTTIVAPRPAPPGPPPVAARPVPQHPIGPPVEPTVPTAPAPIGRWILLAVVASIVVLVLVLVGVTTFFTVRGSRVAAPDPDPTTPTTAPVPTTAPIPVDEWTTYPGTAYDDSATVLAAPSLETVTAEGEAYLAAYRDTLTMEYGITWTQTYDGNISRSDNGYGGESLLYDYNTPEWQGTVALDDRETRQRIVDEFQAQSDTYGATEVWRANDLYVDDETASKRQYGAAEIAEQPMWVVYADGVVAPGTNAVTRVVDLNLPRDPTFNGDFWFQLGDVPAGSVVVTVSLARYGVLSDVDRQAFVDGVAAFDEENKPEPR